MSNLASTTYVTALTALRSVIITQLGISAERVMNAVSVRGPELWKIISSTEINSFNLNDSFIVFEFVINDADGEFGAVDNKDGTSEVLMPYVLKMKFYGNSCNTASQTLLASFKTSDVAITLRNAGVWVYGISKPTSINEFLNNTVWPRVDMDVKVQLSATISTTEATDWARSYKSITIQVAGNNVEIES